MMKKSERIRYVKSQIAAMKRLTALAAGDPLMVPQLNQRAESYQAELNTLQSPTCAPTAEDEIDADRSVVPA